jgi:hypothetical protein
LSIDFSTCRGTADRRRQVKRPNGAGIPEGLNTRLIERIGEGIRSVVQNASATAAIAATAAAAPAAAPVYEEGAPVGRQSLALVPTQVSDIREVRSLILLVNVEVNLIEERATEANGVQP